MAQHNCCKCTIIYTEANWVLVKLSLLGCLWCVPRLTNNLGNALGLGWNFLYYFVLTVWCCFSVDHILSSYWVQDARVNANQPGLLPSVCSFFPSTAEPSPFYFLFYSFFENKCIANGSGSATTWTNAFPHMRTHCLPVPPVLCHSEHLPPHFRELISLFCFRREGQATANPVPFTCPLLQWKALLAQPNLNPQPFCLHSSAKAVVVWWCLSGRRKAWWMGNSVKTAWELDLCS